jgi:hypothetical protein
MEIRQKQRNAVGSLGGLYTSQPEAAGCRRAHRI